MKVTPGAQSFSSISDASDDERGLSKYAAEQIHKHIVKPILREESLKEFHDLIKTVPERIGDKEIRNLRDLEKTLIFLAPVSSHVRSTDGAFTYGCSGVKDYSRSPSKYLRFCERTIRVLHTTVTTLHESDQRAPTDRPYTQGYFFELVEQVRAGTLTPRGAAVINILLQIRRYATILAITREKQAKGEKLDAMDVTKYVYFNYSPSLCFFTTTVTITISSPLCCHQLFGTIVKIAQHRRAARSSKFDNTSYNIIAAIDSKTHNNPSTPTTYSPQHTDR